MKKPTDAPVFFPTPDHLVATIMTDSAQCAGVSQPLQPRNWSLEPRDTKLVKRARALASSDIKKIDVADLDALLAPYMYNGLLRTTYERCTGATEYRGPSGRVIAVSIGGHHFARRYTPLALYMQHVGRIKRHMPPAPLLADGRALPDAPISGPTCAELAKGPRTLAGLIDRWTDK